MSRDTTRLVSPLDRALWLRTLPEMSGVAPANLTLMAQHARERSFARGDRLLRAGERVDAFHLVVEGEVSASGAAGRDRRIGPGQAVGLLSMLAGNDEGVEAVAETDTLSLEFDADTILDLSEEHFSLLQTWIRNLATRTLTERRRLAPESDLAPWPAELGHPGRELDLVERLVVLRRAPTFERASLGALAQIARDMEERTFAAGTELWKTGDVSRTLLVLVRGQVLCSLPADEGKFRCGPGYPLGNLESLADSPRWYDAVTATEVVALEARTESFLDVLEDHFEMATDLLAAMAQHLIHLLASSPH